MGTYQIGEQLHAVLPEPSLFAHTLKGTRESFRQRSTSLALLIVSCTHTFEKTLTAQHKGFFSPVMVHFVDTFPRWMVQWHCGIYERPPHYTGPLRLKIRSILSDILLMIQVDQFNPLLPSTSEKWPWQTVWTQIRLCCMV